MRNNQPVTRSEYVLHDDDVLISRSDLQGNITYANAVFVAVSGYERDELLGAPHNILRHPDIPPAIFASLWQTLNAGHTWQGVLKNRRKNGGFYWVHATVAPLYADGELMGYTSVRRRASEAGIARAEAVYADMWQHNGKLRGYRVRRGTLYRAGLRGLWERFSLSSIRARLGAMALVMSAFLVLVGVLGHQQLLAAQAAAVALGVGVAGLMGVTLARSISRALADARQVAFQVAAGNLAAQVDTARRDELGDLLRAIDIMRASLSGIAGEVGERVNVVTPAAERIAADNEDLSARTEQQAAALQQTAASMDELTATVQQNTANAGQATRLADDNTRESIKTGEQMQALVTRMERIAETSRRMDSILGTIDGIAFQTNILALNASVEAARAGEAGRGFAVVASEVRTLAERSAGAAGEIRTLITNTHAEVESGQSDAQQAHKALENVVTQVRQVSELLQSISQASEEQSSGVSQVNTAVNEMDQVTQQNAGQVQAVAGAASALTAEASSLADVVAAFRLIGSGAESIRGLPAAQADVGEPPVIGYTALG